MWQYASPTIDELVLKYFPQTKKVANVACGGYIDYESALFEIDYYDPELHQIKDSIHYFKRLFTKEDSVNYDLIVSFRPCECERLLLTLGKPYIIVPCLCRYGEVNKKIKELQKDFSFIDIVDFYNFNVLWKIVVGE